ncbi:MAG: ABC transporter substrate-binding protein [Clostridia bacterium]|nr:ABC transporter substrate-binding protein [Clostridia bacterium]
MKKFFALILAALMLFSLTACSQSNVAVEEPAPVETETAAPAPAPIAEVEEGLLRVAALYDISTMDVAQTTDNYMVPMNIFDRLFEVEVQDNGGTEIVPSLCTGYTPSEDGLTYTFTLREGVVFSNGSALTASDVQYTFERLLTAGGVNDDIPLEVAGAEALKNGEADTLAGFSVISDTEFSITLAAPNAGFIAELTGPAMSVVDKETMEQVTNFGIACEDTIGTGPYKITEWVVNDHYTLEYNENYWGEEPSVKKMIVSIIPDASTQNLMYQNGELDIIDLEYLDSAIVESTYKTNYADSIIAGSRVGLTYLAMNANHEFLSDVNVRKAVQMAIDVDSIIASVYAGDAIPESGIIPTGVWGHNDALERPAYDVEAAKALLAEAGYAEGEISFELAMDSSSSSNTQLVYQIVQQYLKAIGINAEIATYDESSWLDLRKSGEMDAFIANWTMDYNDPANIMFTFYGSEEKTKIRSLNYADEAIMARVAAASSITDDAARMAEYQALEQKIVVEDAAWVPLLGNMHLFALGQRVADFVPYWAGYSNFYAKDVTLN